MGLDRYPVKLFIIQSNTANSVETSVIVQEQFRALALKAFRSF
jgi:hypothetical protein